MQNIFFWDSLKCFRDSRHNNLQGTKFDHFNIKSWIEYIDVFTAVASWFSLYLKVNKFFPKFIVFLARALTFALSNIKSTQQIRKRYRILLAFSQIHTVHNNYIFILLFFFGYFFFTFSSFCCMFVCVFCFICFLKQKICSDTLIQIGLYGLVGVKNVFWPDVINFEINLVF